MQEKIKRKCEICGKEYACNKSSNGTTCSKSCAAKLAQKRRTPERKAELAKKYGELSRRIWESYTPEQRKLRGQNMSKGWSKMLSELSKEEKQKFHDDVSRRSTEAYAKKTPEEKEYCSYIQKCAWARKTDEEKHIWWTNVLAGHGGTMTPGKTTKSEIWSYERVKEVFPDAIHHYFDERYKNPKNNNKFECDIYVPCKDAFIECQYYITHRGHEYNPDNPEDLVLIEKLKNKNGCDYTTFSERDPLKRKVAKTNNLRFFEVWKPSQIKNLIEELKQLPDI